MWEEEILTFSFLMAAKLPQVDEYTEGIQSSKTVLSSCISRFLSHP